MNREDIIRMAREAGLERNGYWEFDMNRLARFAALVAAAERERIKAANAPEIERINAHIKTLEKTVADERIVDDLCLLHLGWKAGADGDIYRDLYRAAMDRVVARAIRARTKA